LSFSIVVLAMMMMLPTMMLLMVLLWCLPLLRATTDGPNDQYQSRAPSTCTWSETTQRDECPGADRGSNDNDHGDAARKAARKPPEQCRIVLAPSKLGGYGVFPLTKLRRGQAVLSGDLVIHLVDYDADKDLISKSSSSTIMADSDNNDYWRRWTTDDTGGMYEGKDVHRILVHAPGIGMVAHGDSGYVNSATNTTAGNLLPGVPRVDEGGLTRAEYPGTGAITHYHNWTFYVRAVEIAPGEELLVQYQHNFAERGRSDHDASRTTTRSATSSSKRRSVDWLRENGWCLDNVRPIPVSKYQHAGRGLVARRPLAAGAVVAPVPVRAIRRSSLRIKRRQRQRADGKTTTLVDEETEQLLINYCFGHPDSSFLLYSYGPMVKYVFVAAVEDPSLTHSFTMFLPVMQFDQPRGWETG
jgi:hypothetical protein